MRVWCQSTVRGRSMTGSTKLIPELSVLWYLPSRSMIMVCACWTTRMLFEIRTMTPNTTAPTRIVPGPIRLRLLLDHEGRAIHLNDRHLRAGLEHRRVAGRPAPVFALDLDPAGAAGPDALRHDAGLPEQRIHAGPQLRAGTELEVVHQTGPEARHAGQAAHGERDPLRHKPETGDQPDDAGDARANRQAREPEPCREHLPDEQADRQQKPKQPILHMGQSCNPCTRFAIQLVPIPCGAAMIARAPFVALAVAVLATPVAAQTSRYTLKGDSVAVYNLVGELRVEAGTGSDVVVELQRGGADAAKLDVQSGPLRGRETLRITYPDDVIVVPELGRGGGWNTTLRVRDDGTFGDDRGRHERGGWFGEGHQVRITGRSRDGLEAHADLRVTVPRGKNIALYLGVGKAFISNVDGAIRVSVASADVSADRTTGSLKVETGSGNVDLRTAAGDISLETGSGDLTV